MSLETPKGYIVTRTGGATVLILQIYPPQSLLSKPKRVKNDKRAELLKKSKRHKGLLYCSRQALA